ncbi:hypothetical protein DF186_16045, partial [Enterococcus hirae]
VDAPQGLPRDVEDVEGHQDPVEEPGVLRIEVLLVAAERDVVHQRAIDLVLARRLACRRDHRVARGRVEAEVVPDVGEGLGALVGAALGEDA